MRPVLSKIDLVVPANLPLLNPYFLLNTFFETVATTVVGFSRREL